MLFVLAPPTFSAEVEQSRIAHRGQLFDNFQTLNLELTMSKEGWCRSRDREKCRGVPATLAYQDEEGVHHDVTATVRVRGRWKPDNGNCRFPALFIFFESKGNDPLFAGQEMLPLTTHCQRGRENEQYVLKEYLAYRILNVLTDKSLRVRLARVSYREPGEPSVSMVRYGFFHRALSRYGRPA